MGAPWILSFGGGAAWISGARIPIYLVFLGLLLFIWCLSFSVPLRQPESERIDVGWPHPPPRRLPPQDDPGGDERAHNMQQQPQH